MKTFLAIGALLALLILGSKWVASSNPPDPHPLVVAPTIHHFREKTYQLSDHQTLIVADVPDVLSPQLADRCFILEDTETRATVMRCLNGVSFGDDQ